MKRRIGSMDRARAAAEHGALQRGLGARQAGLIRPGRRRQADQAPAKVTLVFERGDFRQGDRELTSLSPTRAGRRLEPASSTPPIWTTKRSAARSRPGWAMASTP